MTRNNEVNSGLRGKARLAAGAAGLTLLGITAALAVSVVLAPGATVPVPATTAATEPVLDGTVLQDPLVHFVVKNDQGEVLCEGQLQDRVVKSAKTGLLDFYYQIRDTSGTGAIAEITTTSFASQAIRVAYRTDGTGTVPPRFAHRSGPPGALVTFEFTDPPLSCANHEQSRFMLIETQAKAYHPGGHTLIVATGGESISVPTVEP